jgi:two-component system chemotaxis response regulator CheY
MCESLMPDVLIVDWHMPVMSGMEFLARLRAMNGGTRPKVLFCTTKAGIDFIREALAAGADEYIVKPFDKAMLAGKLVQLDVLGKPKT